MSSNYKLSKPSSSRSTSLSSAVNNNENAASQQSNGLMLNGLVNFETNVPSSIRSSIRYKGVFSEETPLNNKNGKTQTINASSNTASPTPYSPNLANIRSKTKDGGVERDGSPLLSRGLFRGNSKASSAQDNRNGLQQQQQEANYDNLLGSICPPSNSMHSLSSSAGSLERGGPGRMSLQSPHPHHSHHQQHQHVSPQHNIYPCAATYGQIQTGRSKVFDIDGKITWVEIVEPKSKTKMFANLST